MEFAEQLSRRAGADGQHLANVWRDGTERIWRDANANPMEGGSVRDFHELQVSDIIREKTLELDLALWEENVLDCLHDEPERVEVMRAVMEWIEGRPWRQTVVRLMG